MDGRSFTRAVRGLCAGLDILAQDMLSSGNPAPWDVEAGARSRELVALLHKRGRDAEHWAVRIDRAASRITHVSAGPVLRIFDFKPDVSAPLRCLRVTRRGCGELAGACFPTAPSMLAGFPQPQSIRGACLHLPCECRSKTYRLGMI